jgi:outer membrane cobalamin receptor
LYSQSFRSPSIQNFHEPLTGSIKPERSSVVELELGYQFTPEMLFSVNAFNISTKNTIIFGSQGDGDTYTEWYQNFSRSGSHGLEAVYSIRKKRWYANFSYSYNAANSNNTLVKYQVPQTRMQYAGFPLNKITLNTSFKLTERLNFNPTFVYASKRYAYTTTDADGNPVSTSLSPYFLANAFFNYTNLFIPGLTLGVGAYDILNQHPVLPQAYNGGYAPVPGRSREWVVKLSYQLDFKK